MRRLFVAAALCAACLLITGIASAGTVRHVNGGVHPGLGAAASAPYGGAFARAEFVPLGARMANPGVSGTVYDSGHNPIAGAEVEWDSWSDADQQWHIGTTTTNASGSYAVSPLATSYGQIYAALNSDNIIGRLLQNWAENGAYSLSLYPGLVNVSAARSTDSWSTFSNLWVRLRGDSAYTYQHLTASSTNGPLTGQATALDGTYTGGSVNFYYDQGIEFAGPIVVASGATSASMISVDQAHAQRVWIGAPYWGSGKPGATLTLTRDNFPAGWKSDIVGYSDPAYTAVKAFGVKTSQGGQTENVSVKVPSTAKPGYGYWIGFQHVDGDDNALPLYVESMYQVSTMKPSKSRIARGARIRLTGIVPTEGHWGSQLGQRKRIAVWWHKGTAPVPKVWNPRAKGWALKAMLQTSGTGAYSTPLIKPAATGTFVVQYEGDDWYMGAYTSTAKVTVR